LTNEIAKGVKEEIKKMIGWMDEQELDDQQIEAVVKEILSTQDDKGNNIRTIFVAGWGRSGFVGEAFAMRLAHLKLNARYITEATLPAFKKGDLFFVISGAGKSLKGQIETALEIGTKIISVTSLAGSIGARLADIKFIIPGRKEDEEGADLNFFERQMKGIPVFLLGTAFELLAMIVLDAITTQIAVIKKKTNEDLKKEHSNVPPI
jgi:6-phospho-3-hexuloisomerase